MIKLAAFTGAVLVASTMSAWADASADGVLKAKESLAVFQAKPAFIAPAPPFDARGCAGGKKMLAIPNTSANPFLKGIIDREIAAGAELGLKVREWQNQGLPSQWVQGFELAIRDKYDIIDLVSSIDPQTLRPQVKAASEAGVKVMTTHFYDPTMKQDPLVSSSLTLDYSEVGKILANWSTVNTDGAANIVLIVMNEVPTVIPLVAGIKSELAANCPKCKIVQEINVGVTEWATKIQPAVQSVVQANPEVNVVIPIFDAMSQFVVPALRLTSKTGKVKIATFNGTPFALDYIQQGLVDMDIGESLDWIAYATVDGHLRDACGMKSPTALNVPLYIFDKSNAKDASTPAKFDAGYGDAYKSGFRKLWGLE